MSRSHLLLALLLMAVVLPLGAQDGVGAGDRSPTAWEEYVSRHPEAVDDDTIGPLERRVLHALTPEQAEAFFGGTAPSQIVLASGETLAEFLLDSVGGGPGLVYVPVDPCRIFSTFLQTAPVTGAMAAGEVREYVARGSGTAHTDQGGIGGCLIADEAVAVVMHFRVVGGPLPPGNGFLKAWRADGPEPATTLLDYETAIRRWTTASLVELCPLGACAGGEFKVKTITVGGQVRGDVAGYFRPIEVADVPGAGNADTLDGLDSTDFALATHTHDGGDITSGTVGEPFIDPLIARDSEVVDLLKAGDGTGSGFDADLLDGKHASAFRPRPQNVILVDGSGGGDFTTISAALASISGESATNRFLIRVGVGTYNEQVTMKSFVDIEGKGKKATIISAPSQAGPSGTVECADDAELRRLTVESTGGAEKAIAIRCLGTSPMVTHVKAVATGASGGATPENIGVLNDGAGAMPMLTGVWVDANPSPGLGVVNQNGAMPAIRDSDIAGADSAVENRDTATAKIANTALAGGADFMAPATQSSYACVRAYVSGTLQELNAECNPNTPPTATDDSYKTLGNTLLEVDLAAASGDPAVIGEDPGPPTVYADVLDNDTDAETPGSLTASAPATSTLGGDVAMNPDGSFSYTPPVGMTGVTDDFTYTVTDPGGLMDTGLVEIAISQMIWFVDDVNGSDATGDGRSDGPFASLAPLDTGGTADGSDGSGDTIFVFADDGATAGGILLETNQVLQGHEVALDFAGFNFAAGSVLVTASTAPSIEDAAGDVIELASGNTVRGLDIAATGGRAIFGNSVAGATIDGVGTSGSGSGTGIRLDGATGTFTFSDLDVGSSTDAGIDIQGGSATFTFDSLSSISSTGAPGFNVNGGTAQVTYSGDITQANNFPAISITGHANGAGTGITFDTGTINASNGTGIQLSGANGTYDFNGTTTLNGGDAGIDILGASSGSFTFANTDITNPTGPAFVIDGQGGLSTVQVDFQVASSVNQANNAAAVLIADHDNAAGPPFVQFIGPVNATGGTGYQFDNADGVYSFNAANSLNGGDAGVDILNGSAGGFTFANLTITSPTNGAFNVDSSSPLISYTGGAIVQNSAATAYRANGNTGNAQNISVPITANTSTANGIDLTSNGSASFTFSGLLDIDTTTGTGFNVTGGGTVQATNAGNTVTTVGDGIGSGIGVNIGASIGALGVGFNTVDVGSSAKANSGILLANTGSSGTFSVAGGLIQNVTSRGFDAANVDGTVDIGASIQNDGGRSVEIGSSSDGDFTFTGAIDDDAQGIDISINTAGASFTFSGGIDIDTVGANTGFEAFSGGVLNICSDSNCDGTGAARVNTVNTSAGTGRAVVIDGVDIGTLGAGPPTVYGVTFESITVDGAPEGIVLDDASTGGFLVTGDGGTAQNGSGGTLRNITGDGIELTDVSNIELNQVAFGAAATTGTDGHCVLGLRVVNLEINNSTFNNHGDADEENCFTFTVADGSGQAGITGTFTLDNVDVEDFFENGVEIFNESGNLVMNVVNGSDFEDNDDTFGNRAIFVETEGTAGIQLTVNGSTFTDIEENIVRFEAGGSGTNDVDIIGNSAIGAGGPDDFPNGGGIELIPTDDATLTFDIKGNTLTDMRGDPIILSGTSGGGNLEGRIGGPNPADGNTLSGSCLGDGISITMDGFATNDAHDWTILVQNNDIGVDNTGGGFQGLGDDGIQVLHRDNGGTLNLTVEDNEIRTGSVSAGICGGGDTAGPGSEAFRIFSDEDLGIGGTVPNNNVRFADNAITVASAANEIELRTSDTADSCYHVIDNDNGSGGSPGVINFSIGGSSSGEITQASLAALSAANNGATTSGATPSFGGSCTNPTLPSN